jgi:hypothetical protein
MLIFMEMSLRKLLSSYLKQTKMSFFFFFYKIRELEGRTGSAWGICTSGEGKDVGKGCRRVNIYKYCVYMYVNETF